MSVPAARELEARPAACAGDEADSEPESGAGLGLSLGHSCHRMLVWDCARIRPEIAEALPEVLAAAGYSEDFRSPLVRELVHPREHSVVIVPRTGRLQIRVHYLTPHEARARAASEVARELALLVERAATALDRNVAAAAAEAAKS